MNGTLQRLAARALGVGNIVRPRVVGWFETPRPAADLHPPPERTAQAEGAPSVELAAPGPASETRPSDPSVRQEAAGAVAPPRAAAESHRPIGVSEEEPRSTPQSPGEPPVSEPSSAPLERERPVPANRRVGVAPRATVKGSLPRPAAGIANSTPRTAEPSGRERISTPAPGSRLVGPTPGEGEATFALDSGQAPAWPARRRSPPEAAGPSIEITIGRIDIRAERPSAPPPKRPRRPLISLEDYVSGNRKGRR